MVKVLEFGLAKVMLGGEAHDLADSPTITAIGTRAGTILGTAPYMSPEQAKGRRTDLRAFGAVLYEMLSGSRAFPGDSVSETLANILTQTPNWSCCRRIPPHPFGCCCSGAWRRILLDGWIPRLPRAWRSSTYCRRQPA